MLSELQTKNKVVGLKQTRRAIMEKAAVKVFLAGDASNHIRKEIELLCDDGGIPLEIAPAMDELGRECGIDVATAVAAITKREAAGA